MQIFEQQVIYDLKNKNQMLQMQLASKGHYSIPTKDTENYLSKKFYELTNRLDRMLAQNKKLDEYTEFGGFETVISRSKTNQDSKTREH